MIRHLCSAVVPRSASPPGASPGRPARGRGVAAWRVCLYLAMLAGVASCNDGPTSGLGGDGTIQGPPKLVAGIVDTGRVIPGGTNTFVIELRSGQPARLFLQATSGRAADTLVAELAETATVHHVTASVTSVGTDTALDDQVSTGVLSSDSTTYVVTVRGVGADDAGPYRLLVRVTDPRPESRERTIAVGDTIGEAIDPYGDVDEFSFAGAAGEELIVFFQALEEQPVANLMLTLTDSTTHDQLRILGSAGRADALEDESTGRLLLPSTGRYVMRIEGASYFSYGPKNGRGPYRFFVYPVHRAPEDSPATVTIGDTVTESIGAVGDIDEFTFDGTAGEEVNVNLQILAGLSSGVWLEVRHGQSQDAAVTTRVPGALDNNGTGRFTLPVTGAYTVRLSGAEAGAPDSTTGRYRFEIYRVDRRPEDTSATVSIGDTVTGESIDRPGDVDEFRFTGLSGEQLQVFFNLVDPGGSKKLRLDVIAPGGTTTVGTASVGLPGEYSPAFQLGATGRFTMPTAGTYTLRVYGLDVSVGAYTVELYHVDPAPEVAAAEVPLGVWVTGESLDRPGDVDTYTVDATSGQRLIMRVVAAPGSPDGFYLLSEIPYWQTSSGQYASHRYTIPETKTYPLRVVGDLLGQSEYGVGPYELMVYASDPAPETASAAYTVGDTVVNEAIDLAGDIDEFTFAATAGDTLDVYFDAMDGSVERDFVLIVENARTGESIFGAGTSGVGGNAGTFVVPSTDSYRVMIDNLRTAMTGDVDPSAVGPYRFAITSHQP